MTIKEIHDFIDLLAGHDQADYFNPGQKDAALDRASMWLFNRLLPDFAKTAEIDAALKPFKDQVSFSTDSDGVYNLAANKNYLRLLLMQVSVVNELTSLPETFAVEFPKEDELASRLNSKLDPPLNTAPVGEEKYIDAEKRMGGFKLWPEQVHAGTIRFFRRPAKPVFDYEMDGRNVVWNEGASTNLEWSEPYLNEVVLKACVFLGINVTSELLMKAGVDLPALKV